MKLSLFVYAFAALLLSSHAAAPDADPTKQTDADWMDDRWQKTDVGQLLGAAINTPGKLTPKGIAIKVGEQNEAAVCFDTDLLRYSAAWTGGFLQFHAQRYGLIVPPKPQGVIMFSTAARPGWAHKGEFEDPRANKIGPLPKHWGHYKGIYRAGKRVAVAYTVGSASVLDSPWIERAGELVAFTRTLNVRGVTDDQLFTVCEAEGSGSILTIDTVQVAILRGKDSLTAVALKGSGSLAIQNSAIRVRLPAAGGNEQRAKVFTWVGKEADLSNFAKLAGNSAAPESLSSFTAGGPSQWRPPLITKGALGSEKSPLAIDTITVPFENRWNALFFIGGHDFFRNGDAAVATIHGDVWRVSGLDADLKEIHWKRYATGLYQPLGVKVINDKVHIMERDQITILHDLNGDNEADYYENLNNDTISAGGGHSYATSLETDSRGNFYFTKCAENTPHGGSLIRVSANGSKLDVLATGFRNPNGLGIGPHDEITVADQQGDWVPETRLDLIKPGGFYGFMPMHHRATPPTDYDRPLLWVPRALDNSAGGQVWVPQDKWAPLSGQMLHLSYGRCSLLSVLRDGSNPAQAGVVSLPGRFLSGIMRGRFNPHDGHLYVSGLRGWQTAAVHDGSFQRVRRTAAPLILPIAYKTSAQGLQLTFNQPLDKAAAEDVGSYGVEQWNYKWSQQYGSPDYSVEHPDQQKRDNIPVTSAKLESDGRTVNLQTALRPAMQLRVRYSLDTREGQTLRNDFYATIHELKP